MGWSLLFLPLWLATGAAFYFRARSLRRQLVIARRAREKAELEESRLFDFLHSLGEAFSSDLRPDDLHRLIVESAIRILEAHGGALYTANRDGLGLVARFVSRSGSKRERRSKNVTLLFESYRAYTVKQEERTR